MASNLERDRIKYIKIVDMNIYNRSLEIYVFCMFMSRYDNFINKDILKAWKRLDRRLNLEEEDKITGQLSLFW